MLTYITKIYLVLVAASPYLFHSLVQVQNKYVLKLKELKPLKGTFLPVSELEPWLQPL